MKSHFQNIVIITLLLFPQISRSQSYMFNNQYTVNKYSISPSYAGFSSNNELFVSSGQKWKGVEGAPEFRSINFNSALIGKSGYGAFISEKSEGIFNYLSMGLSYSYSININEDNQFILGTSLEYYESNINADNENTSSVIDPEAYKYNSIEESFLNASFGLLYINQNLNIGFSLPNLGNFYNKNSKTSNDENILRAHLSYLKPINKNIDIETFAMVQNDDSESLLYCLAISLRINQLFWIGSNYRNPSTYGFMMGVNPFNRLLIHYSYETSNSGISNISSGSHEISIGIMFGSYKNLKYRKSSFGNRNKMPYDDWVK